MYVCKQCGHIDIKEGIVPRSRLDAVDQELSEAKDKLTEVQTSARQEIERLQATRERVEGK